MSFREQTQAARLASRELATLTRAAKDQALGAMADALAETKTDVLSANAIDVERAIAGGTADAIVDRLRLCDQRIADMVQGLRDLQALPDPVGDVIRGWRLPNGVCINQVRVPFGVVGVIYEARPNVTADAAGIALKSGNAVLLRGSSSAQHTNREVVRALRRGLSSAGVTSDAVALVTGDRTVTSEMMAARGMVDVLIPRGGAGLINAVVHNAKVPVIETGTGNCHLYVDKAADIQRSLAVMLNAKTQRCSVCNALETMIVHEEIADEFLPQAISALHDAGVTIHGDCRVAQFDEQIVAVTEEELAQEYLTMDIAVVVVCDIEAAIAHIRRYSSGHSETIMSEDQRAIDRFTTEIDAAVVLANVSSRFVDGGQFGFGAEIGISTQKLHARGPMGLAELTSTKYVVRGDGQVRS